MILTVGRWASSEKYKGADDLIRAVAALRASHSSLSLVLVGAGDDLPRLKSIAAAENLGDSAVFLESSACGTGGMLRSREFVCASEPGEGFGLVFLEAMAFAKPVVGVASGGTLDLIRDGKNGLLVPPRMDNPEALVNALERLLRDRNLRDELGRNGADIVANEYSVPAFQQSLESIVSALLV